MYHFFLWKVKSINKCEINATLMFLDVLTSCPPYNQLSMVITKNYEVHSACIKRAPLFQ